MVLDYVGYMALAIFKVIWQDIVAADRCHVVVHSEKDLPCGMEVFMVISLVPIIWLLINTRKLIYAESQAKLEFFAVLFCIPSICSG